MSELKVQLRLEFEHAPVPESGDGEVLVDVLCLVRREAVHNLGQGQY